MSRLPTPGFSRLKAPGFTRPSAPSQVTSTETQDYTFKRPQDVTVPVSQSSMGLAHSKPHNDAVRPRMLMKTYGHPPTSVNSFQHGPSPYNRSRANVSQIPYVGKKRVTGVLKAPESKLSRHPPHQPVLQNQTRMSVQNNVTYGTEQKPIRRQLIPEGKSQPKLIQPKTQASKDRPKSCLVQPRGFAVKPSNDSGNLSGGRGLSRSLQTLPQGLVKPRGAKKETWSNRSASQENLISEPRKRPTSGMAQSRGSTETLNSRIAASTGSLNKFGAPSGLSKKIGAANSTVNKFAGKTVRPRVSTLNNSHNSTVNISTPCHTTQPPGKEHLKHLKISPIGNSEDPNSTFDLSQTIQTNNAANETRIVEDKNHNETSVFDSSNMQFTAPVSDLNATYNRASILNKTEIISTDSNESQFENVESDSSVVNASDVGTEENYGVESLDQTRVIHSQYFDETRTIHHVDDNNEFNESKDFIGNETMPKNLGDDTPYKTNLNESALEMSENSPFTEDILKVIAAISSNLNTRPTNVVTVTTSPLKQSTNVTTLSNSVTKKLELTNEVSLSDELSFAETHFGTPKQLQLEDFHEEVSHEKEFSETHEILQHREEIDHFKVRTLSEDVIEEDCEKTHLKTQSMLSSPTTPNHNELGQEFNFSHPARCNTVSLGVLSRGGFKDGKFSKLIRRNTFASQDLTSKFRVPKEMNLTETLEGNIVMDNTSFLHFSNDVRSMKTQLLKLKRTLLEADCPSPLMKMPLKRSNSCVVRNTMDAPPLSPRTCMSSPMAVVDPLVQSEANATMKEKHVTAEKEDQLAAITNKFQDALRRIEEMEKEIDCHKYTIKLLQTQLEKNEQNEMDILEENIILREEVGHLTERLQKLNENAVGEDGEKLLSSGSYKEEFDLAEMSSSSRKVVLQRLYSNDSNTD